MPMLAAEGPEKGDGRGEGGRAPHSDLPHRGKASKGKGATPTRENNSKKGHGLARPAQPREARGYPTQAGKQRKL